MKSLVSILVVMSLLIGSCKTLKENKRTAIGVGSGAAIGGALGGLLGKKSGNTAGGIIIGATVGGVAGGAIGRYMDKQKKELEAELGKDARVERIGEGLDVTFDAGILFPTASYTLNADARKSLTDFAEVLKKYPDTYLLIDGHTDNVGSDSRNERLSIQRAEAVSNFLQLQGVTPGRIGTRGFGENQPVGDNNTVEGRQANRRVEVAIFANEELKKKAEDGQLESTDESRN